MVRHAILALTLVLHGPRALAGQDIISISREVVINGYEEGFVPIGALSLGPDGRVAVTQPMDGVVRFFDKAGTPLGSVGRLGDGPGEFRSFIGVGWLSDTLWVFDGKTDRFTLISEGLEVARTYRGIGPVSADSLAAAGVPNFGVAIPKALFSDGSMFARLELASAHSERFPANSATHAKISADGIIQSITSVHRTPRGFFYQGANGSTAGGNFPFQHQPFLAVSPDGHWAVLVNSDEADSEERVTLRIHRFDLQTGEVVEATHDYLGERIPASVVFEAISKRSRSWSGAAARAYRGQASVPVLYPPVLGVAIGSSGEAWVQLRETETGTPHLVLRTDGSLASAVLPPRTRVAAVGDGIVWALVLDDFDVESLWKFRVGTDGVPP